MAGAAGGEVLVERRWQLVEEAERALVLQRFPLSAERAQRALLMRGGAAAAAAAAAATVVVEEDEAAAEVAALCAYLQAMHEQRKHEEACRWVKHNLYGGGAAEQQEHDESGGGWSAAPPRALLLWSSLLLSVRKLRLLGESLGEFLEKCELPQGHGDADAEQLQQQQQQQQRGGTVDAHALLRGERLTSWGYRALLRVLLLEALPAPAAAQFVEQRLPAFAAVLPPQQLRALTTQVQHRLAPPAHQQQPQQPQAPPPSQQQQQQRQPPQSAAQQKESVPPTTATTSTTLSALYEQARTWAAGASSGNSLQLPLIAANVALGSALLYMLVSRSRGGSSGTGGAAGRGGVGFGLGSLLASTREQVQAALAMATPSRDLRGAPAL